MHKWFDKTFFNLLVDYYPDIPFRPYGSGSTRRNVLPVLEKLKPGYIIIYAKGHSGYTTFRSSLGTDHKMLAKDMPAFFRKITRETGTKLILYYSGLLDGIAGLRHPEWVMRNHPDDKSSPAGNSNNVFTYLNICPQSAYFDEWVKIHLEEMISRYDPDGIWVDGDWPGLCYCRKCRERFRKDTGHKGYPPYIHVWTGPLPTTDGLTPETIQWMKTWSTITHEWRTGFRGYVKKLKPSCLYSAGNISSRSEFAEPFDWRSGDWFSPKHHRLSISFAMRRYSTMAAPYDGFTCDTSFVHHLCDMRSRTKTLDRILQEGATIIANGGKWGYWTYPMPNGAFVPSKTRIAEKALQFAERRKAVCSGTVPVKWTATLYTEPSSNTEFTDDGAAKALIALHKSPLLIDEQQLGMLDELELVVVPDRSVLDERTAERLELFARRGGTVLGTGMTVLSPYWQRLAGIKLVKRAALNDGHVFLKNGGTAGVFSQWDRIKLVSAKEMYPLYLSWDHANPGEKRLLPNYPINGMVDEDSPDPAGFPAASVRRIGKGKVAHICTTPFAQYWKYGYPDILAWISEIIDFLQPATLLRTNAPSFVEVSLRKKNETLLVHLVNGNPGRDMSFAGTTDLFVDEIPETGSFEMEIRCAEKPRRVFWEPGHKVLKFRYKAGLLKITVPKGNLASLGRLSDF